MSDQKIDSFEQSFRAGISTCRLTCNCGMVYWDSYNSGISWEDGEIERLEQMQKEGKAKGVDGSFGILECEGKQYAETCECWHARAKQIMSFLDSHQAKIAAYFKYEKARVSSIAAAIPEIE